MSLRTDALFRNDTADLSDQAKGILDQLGQEIRGLGSPAAGPVTITGHTDSEGSDSDNLDLSKERAEAVREELENRLGATYQYEAEGKGEAELVAKEGGADDTQARSRNRRVEVAYKLRAQTPGAT
ncbi:OmpA family protein, partial [Actinomadura adrarensis]